MVGIKNNRRAQMTKRIIQESLIQLLHENNNSLNEITVTAVCKIADVNRGTFYAHYKDVPDCMRAMEKSVSDELFEELALNQQCDSWEMVLTGILGVVKENHAVAAYILGNDHDFLTHFLSSTKNKLLEQDRKMNPQLGIHESQYMYEFYLNGIVGVIRYWLKNGLQESPEKLARIINECR
ncbi:TetR/AcrR family transcriptional regulator [Liquorilactobacillus capillatus]|uniref:Transcription regulator n=1 Tax=Liquorilactobacillus capillatus DSM 19910 TaxID=1423731 RepID=A0A0R1MA70_9LACO|nr:TetR-like C-terminal domain-containing protein [Liquorilactobacillus capillatus]KRL01754.1 transcription regulator [Liquorilactobacillus capillatus DSM 19910]